MEWSTGVIYCSTITARLLTNIMGVQAQYVRALPMHEEVPLPRNPGRGGREEGGLSVTLLDANHCPGACMLLFRVRTCPGSTTGCNGGYGHGAEVSGRERDDEFTLHLHCGDMRYHPRMLHYAALLHDTTASHPPRPPRPRKLDTIYLDTTYAHPKHAFAAQEDAIQSVGDLILARLRKEGREVAPGDPPTTATTSNNPKGGTLARQSSPSSTTSSLPPPRPPFLPPPSAPSPRPKTLFLLSAYSIGKELCSWMSLAAPAFPSMSTRRR